MALLGDQAVKPEPSMRSPNQTVQLKLTATMRTLKMGTFNCPTLSTFPAAVSEHRGEASVSFCFGGLWKQHIAM